MTFEEELKGLGANPSPEDVMLLAAKHSAVAKEAEALTADDVIDISDRFKESLDNEKPFALMNGDEIAVIGDVNDTQPVKGNYEIDFLVPKHLFEEKCKGLDVVTEEAGDYVKYTQSFTGVYISAQKRMGVVLALSDLNALLVERDMTSGDAALVYKKAESLTRELALTKYNILLALYQAVGIVLELDDELGQGMQPSSVIKAAAQLIRENPDALKEADF